MLGISKNEYEKIRKEGFTRNDVLPLSPLPVIEETIGAILCLFGTYTYFPWKGEIRTFIKGKSTIVKNKYEVECSDVLLQKETIGKTRIEDLEGEINLNKKEGCEDTCPYKEKEGCSFNDITGDPQKATCDDPLVQSQLVNGKTADDFMT